MNAPRVTKSALSPFGRELRKIRVGHSMRLSDVAKALGVTPSFISAIEVGRKPIPDGFVDDIALCDQLAFSDIEIAALRRAVDLSKTTVVIEPNSPEASLLATTLARKIDKLTREEIALLLNMLPCSTKRDADRFRSDIPVRAMSRADIRDACYSLRNRFGFDFQQKFHIVEFVEFDLANALPELTFAVYDDAEMPSGVLGLGTIWPPLLIIAESKYTEAVDGDAHGRWIMAHELGHIWLKHGKRADFAQTRPLFDHQVHKRYPSNISAEFQADEFAAELLMPHLAMKSLSAKIAAKKFGVSEYVAERRLRYMTS